MNHHHFSKRDLGKRDIKKKKAISKGHKPGRGYCGICYCDYKFHIHHKYYYKEKKVQTESYNILKKTCDNWNDEVNNKEILMNKINEELKKSLYSIKEQQLVINQ